MPRQMTNAERLAAHSLCDGFVMLFREVGHDLEQDYLYALRGYVLANTNCPEEEVNRYVKFKVLRDDHSPHGRLARIHVTGAAARVLGFLPWSWAAHVTEAHFKAWSDEVYQGATDAFVDQLYQTDDLGAMKANFFGKDKRKSTTKAGGSRGARLGSKKSDIQAVSYKRANERTGHEVRVKDKVLFRIWLDVSEVREQVGEGFTDGAAWGLYHGKAARAGFVKFMAELKRRGVKFTDFFSTATSEAKGAVADDGATFLDPKEDSML